MERLERATIITSLIAKLREAKSWCGETHIQKAVYLLEELLDVPIDYRFVLYKHGPFSFDLSYELTSFRADDLVELEPQTPPYGPRYVVTDLGRALCEKFSSTLRKHDRDIEVVAGIIGTQTVADLERLATALYVTKHPRDNGEDQELNSVILRAQRLHAIKPHIPVDAAIEAVKRVDELQAEFAPSIDKS